MKTISTMIMKGGTGKTTSVSAIASGLTAAGKTVLLVDLDPQQNLAYVEGVDISDIPCTLYDVWTEGEDIRNAVQSVSVGKDIVTGGIQLINAAVDFAEVKDNYRLLQNSLKQIQDKYDFCLIDCPPGLGLLAMNAATASDDIIVPMTIDALSITGLSQLWEFVRNVKAYCNPDVSVAGVIITKYDSRTTLTKVMEPQIEQTALQAGTKVFRSRIHASQAITTAQALQDTSVYRKSSRAAKDYRELVSELLSMYEERGEE